KGSTHDQKKRPINSPREYFCALRFCSTSSISIKPNCVRNGTADRPGSIHRRNADLDIFIPRTAKGAQARFEPDQNADQQDHHAKSGKYVWSPSRKLDQTIRAAASYPRIESEDVLGGLPVAVECRAK